MEEKYIINKGESVIKEPKEPNPSDYFNILETEGDRLERIYLYSEVKDNE